MFMEPSLIEDGRLEFSTGEGTAEVRIYNRGGGDILIKGPIEVETEGER